MATKRAFHILEQRNTNENQHVGKTPLAGKNEARFPLKLALKDLTNNSSSRSNLVSKTPLNLNTKKGVKPKSFTSSTSSQKKLSDSGPKQQTITGKKESSAAAFNIFTPQDAEYRLSERSCLREDLLEQMIEFRGEVYRPTIKPMRQLRIEPIDLPELDVPQVRKERPPASISRNLLFDLPEVELPDLDFMF
ncbi:uncharacterized protein LOC129733009 [Wyeomyia smithii]|uniref:uncharacterized protein LOC129733009 n=1 Tax=Wyeomyia smithii TaxID=174621 RepID=UPI002467D4E0|nr:uncharacterized protein LOC129733009 [Wyeomyia smithii]